MSPTKEEWERLRSEAEKSGWIKPAAPLPVEPPPQQAAPANPTEQHRRKCPALYGSACTCITPRQVCKACGKAYDLIRSDFGPVTAYGEFWRIPNCAHCGAEPTGIALEGPKPARSNDEVYHDDVADLLRALGLSDHARPYSAHDVLQREVLPRISELYAGLEVAVRAGNEMGLRADAAYAALRESREKVAGLKRWMFDGKDGPVATSHGGLVELPEVLALIDAAVEAQREEKR